MGKPDARNLFPGMFNEAGLVEEVFQADDEYPEIRMTFRPVGQHDNTSACRQLATNISGANPDIYGDGQKRAAFLAKRVRTFEYHDPTTPDGEWLSFGIKVGGADTDFDPSIASHWMFMAPQLLFSMTAVVLGSHGQVIEQSKN